MKDNCVAVLLEEIRSQNRIVVEAVKDMQVHVKEIPVMQADLKQVKQDIKIIKVAVTETNKDVRSPETRITALEAA